VRRRRDEQFLDLIGAQRHEPRRPQRVGVDAEATSERRVGMDERRENDLALLRAGDEFRRTEQGRGRRSYLP